MIDWFTNALQALTAQIVFLTITVMGATFSAISLIFGGEHDGGGDHGDFHADHAGGSDHHDGHDGEGSGLVGMLAAPLTSIRGLSFLATGFGAFGYITFHLTQRVLFSCVVGIIAGWLLSLLAVLFVRQLIKQQSSSLVDEARLIGLTGIVTTKIPANGFGEVQVTLSGKGQFTKTATASHEIPYGAVVKILQRAGNAVVVDRT
jgi:membrane protein implicated in regulation of membrane protease activity